MKNQIRTLLSIFIITLLISLSMLNIYGLSIPKVPTEDIYVQDYASLISDEAKGDMLKMSAALKNTTSAELVVVTVPSMNGRSIEEYSLNLFRQWGIGSEEENNGVLLLIADEEREARIEVGYGLEGAINDAKAGAILDEMIAYFQVDNYSEGITTAYSLLLNEIAVEYDVNIDNIFEEAKVITPATLPQPISIAHIFKMIILLFLSIIMILFVLSKIIGISLFKLISTLFRGLGGGRYMGPTFGGPNYMGRQFGRGFTTHHRSSPFGGSSHRGGSIGGGKFGGGSSGGGGASRKW